MRAFVYRALCAFLICMFALTGTVNAAPQWRNFLLVGMDSRAEGMKGLTDTMIIASVDMNSGAVKLTSLMRDTWVNIPGKGYNKLNSAHSLGGIKLLLKTVEENYKIKIAGYAKIDMYNLQYAVDAVGGIDIKLKKSEVQWINRGMVYLLRKEKQLKRYNGDIEEGQLPKDAYGNSIHITGRQAVAYARIRNIDSDFQRTSRQRTVLDAMLKKARGITNPFEFAAFAAKMLGFVDTNVGALDALNIGRIILFGSSASFQELRLPADKEYDSGTKNGAYSIRPNWTKTRARLNAFIYDKPIEDIANDAYYVDNEDKAVILAQDMPIYEIMCW